MTAEEKIAPMADHPKIVLCGCHEYGFHLASRLIEQGIRPSAFVCISPEQNEKYRISGYYDLSILAAEHDIPVYVPHTYELSHPDDHAYFATQGFDLLIQGGWQRLFPATVLESLRIGAVGVHGSADLLPKGRGRSPLNWSVLEGKSRFLLQLFLMRPGIDDGDVFDWEQFDINPFDDIRTLYFKNIILTNRMLLRSLPALVSGTLKYVSQQGEPSYYPKRTPEDGLIDWENMDVFAIYNLIRATTRPYPGAYGQLGQQQCRIWRARVFDTRIVYPAVTFGEVVERFDSALVVNCRGGLLLVEEYEPITDEVGQ